MESEYIPLYRHVSVLYWPWLWWQLRIISRWRRETGRALLIATDRCGNIHIRAVGDDPHAPRPGTINVPVSGRLALALSEPESPWSRRMPGPQAIEAKSPAIRGPRRDNVLAGPIPDT